MAEITKASEWNEGTTEIHTFKTGRVAELQRPGPHIYLKFGQLPTHLLSAWQNAHKGTNLEESGMQFMASMTEDEQDKFLLLAKDVVLSVFRKPKIVTDREPVGDYEVRPEAVTGEFWEAFLWGVGALTGAKVDTAGGATTAGAVESFRDQPELSPAGKNGKRHGSSRKQVDGHPRPLDSVGIQPGG